jgi:hypothetical protein
LARSAPPPPGGIDSPRLNYRSLGVQSPVAPWREPSPLDFSQAISSVIEDYQKSTPIAFTQIVDGEAQQDEVNRKFWELRDTGSGWAWTAKQRPSDAVRDVVLNKNPQSSYRTECRMALQLFRVAALLKTDETRFGPEAGPLVFDARFTKPSNVGPIKEWVKKWKNSGERFTVYSGKYPPPTVPSKLTMTRFGASDDFENYNLFSNSELAPGTERPGDEVYATNYGVTPRQLNVGNAGQNGFKLPNDKVYGHGVGVLSLAELRSHLSQASISKMSDFLEYYDVAYTNGSKPTPETGAQVNEWLRNGPLASREKFQEWTKTSDFTNWYRNAFGRTPPRNVSSFDEVKGMIEKMIPDTAKRYTAYTALNGPIKNGPNLVSEQMALFLVGSLPDSHTIYTRTVALE